MVDADYGYRERDRLRGYNPVPGILVRFRQASRQSRLLGIQYGPTKIQVSRRRQQVVRQQGKRQVPLALVFDLIGSRDADHDVVPDICKDVSGGG